MSSRIYRGKKYGFSDLPSLQLLNHIEKGVIVQDSSDDNRCRLQGDPMKSLLYVLATAILVSYPSWAQRLESRPAATLRGSIVCAQPIIGGLTIELSGSSGGPVERTTVEPDNTFEIHSSTPGMHLLEVVDNMGRVLYRENLNVSSGGEQLTIRLSDAPAHSGSAGRVVSLQQLQHKTPPAARKAFQKGQQAEAKHNLEQARGLFQQAIAEDPEYVDAYDELGVVDAHMSDLPAAAEHFQKAVDLAPGDPIALVNLSIVLAKMQHLQEAGQVARRALQVAPGDERMHYILGSSLLSEPAKTDEAMMEFERAAPGVPAAHFVLAELLAARGRSQEAIRHLEDYFAKAAANDPLRPKAVAELAALQR